MLSLVDRAGVEGVEDDLESFGVARGNGLFDRGSVERLNDALQSLSELLEISEMVSCDC